MLAHPQYKETRTGQGCLLPHSSIPYINTGVWGVQPSRRIHHELMEFVASGRSACYDGDQSAAQSFFGYRRA